MIFKLALFFIGCTLYACQIREIPQNQPLAVIPFHLTTHNNISIEAVINNKDTLHLMLHTAANSLDLTANAAQRMSTINWSRETEVNTWGGNAYSRISENNSLTIHDLHWDGVRIFENKHSGPTTGGKLGLQLFSGKVIEINYDQQQILLHQTLPKYANHYTKVPIELEHDMLFINCLSIVSDTHYPHRFLIHSGYGGTILYDDGFVAKSKIGTSIPIIAQQELKDAHGNTLMVKKGEIPFFSVGNFDFENMPVGFFEGAIGRQKMSVLGGDLLRRFNLIIDREKGFIYLQTNQFTKLPFAKKG